MAVVGGMTGTSALALTSGDSGVFLRKSSLAFSRGDDSPTCRVASGMQASCSPCVDALKSNLSRGQWVEQCGISDFLSSSTHRFSQGTHLGFHPLQAARRNETLETQAAVGIVAYGMRYAGRKGVFRTRSQRGDAEGLPSLHSNRGRSWGLPQGDRAPRGLERSGRRESLGAPQSIQCSITKAFSSMVLMLKTLQTYAMEMRSMLFYEDFQSVARVIHREMQASLLWLFQQVFACTPMLMVSVMLLFSDFTAHASSSLTEVEFMPKATVVASSRTPLTLAEVMSSPVPFRTSMTTEESAGSVTPLGGDCGGRGGRPKFLVTPEDDGESLRSSLVQDKQLALSLAGAGKLLDSSCQGDDSSAEDGLKSKLLDLKAETVKTEATLVSSVQLDEEMKMQMVAPVRVRLEGDDYVNFHRTDLEYQFAIEEDPSNPLVLANYAQFLFTVRHDLDRSEDFFHRALRIEPTDGEILGRFATFLWLGRKDKSAAERAFKAAIASSPDNPYFSGSYAHFLWHGGGDETSPL